MRQSAAEPSGGRVTSLLFVCTGNTCRSVMAEALARRRFGDAVRVSSAGMRPQQPADAKNAIEALRADFGLDVSCHVPRSLQDVDLGAFDHVIVLDKSVARQLTGVPKDKLIVQHIDDPWGDDPSQYRQCALRIMQLVSTCPLKRHPHDLESRRSADRGRSR